MKGKIVSLLLCICMIMAMFVGCGVLDRDTTKTSQTEEDTEYDSKEDDSEEEIDTERVDAESIGTEYIEMETETENQSTEVITPPLPDYVEAYEHYVTDTYHFGMFMVKAYDSNIPYLFVLKDSGITIYHYENGSVTENNYLVASHFYGAILANNAIAISERIPMGEFPDDYSYYLCAYANGQIQNNDGFFDGEYIEEAEYRFYEKEGIKLENGYDSIEEAHENVIIWN